MKIRTTLYALVGGLLLIALVTAGAGLYGSDNTLKGLNSVYQDRVVPLRDLKTVADEYAVAIVDAVHKVRDRSLTPDVAVQRMREARTTIASFWESYLGTTLTVEERALADEARERMQTADALIDRLVSVIDALAAAQPGADAILDRLASESLYPAIDPVSNAINALIEVQLDAAKSTYQEQVSTHRSLFLGIIALLAFAIVSGLAVSIWLIRSRVTTPLTRASAFAHQISSADLTGHLTVERDDEIGQLSRSLCAMRDALADVVKLINRNAEQISSSSEELTASSAQIADASGIQSDSASSMAAAVEQMTVAINHMSDFAGQARAVAEESGDASRQGRHVIDAVVADIQKIAESVNQTSVEIQTLGAHSREIATVVGVIKEVADQTNLLALNAAIEAARAGEQGRGFAVVADEVRKLAERTAQSTAHITEIVDNIGKGTERAVESMNKQVAEVEAGVARAKAAGEAIGNINSASDRVVATVEEISGALGEQASASNEIARNVERIASMSEENHASMQESVNAANHLAKLAAHLQQSVGKFRF